MSSVSKPSIIDCIQWGDLHCGCGQHVDVRWLPHRGDPIAGKVDDHLLEFGCPECVLRSLSGKPLTLLRDRYEWMRMMLTELGFSGNHDMARATRHAFRIADNVPTLSGFSWHQQKQNSSVPPYFDLFAFAGELPPSVGRPYEPDDFADFPLFNMDELTRTWVFIGLDFYHPKTKRARARMRVLAQMPTSPYFLVLDGWQRIAAAPAGVLISESLRMLRSGHGIVGRPKGTNYRSTRYYVDGYRKASRELGRPAKQTEFLNYMRRHGDPSLTRDTLQRNLEPARLWPIEKLAKAAARASNRVKDL